MQKIKLQVIPFLPTNCATIIPLGSQILWEGTNVLLIRDVGFFDGVSWHKGTVWLAFKHQKKRVYLVKGGLIKSQLQRCAQRAVQIDKQLSSLEELYATPV